MPATPPFPFKSAPDGEAPIISPATIIQDPVFTISFPNGCTGAAVVQLDRTPLMSREPVSLPDIPGGGWSYNRFLEYLDMGIVPHDDVGGGAGYLWSGLGVAHWDVWIDGVDSGQDINVPDGIVEEFGIAVSPPSGTDWTTPHTIQLRGVFFDRPSYTEYWFSASAIGIAQYGPSTDPADPHVPYVLGGYTFGCDGRSPAFFPSVRWGVTGYHDPWVSAHHAVADTLGPKDRNGVYLGLTGPWGSDVQSQFLSSGPGEVPCTGSGGGAGDVYSDSLTDVVGNSTTYARHQYTVMTGVYTLDVCSPPTPIRTPVFDATRVFKAEA